MKIRKNCRLGAVLALTVAMCIPSLASAQGNQVVNPIVYVQGKQGNKVVGLTPAQIMGAYGFNAIPGNPQGSGQTIAIVTAFDDPNLDVSVNGGMTDLQVFNSMFNLPALVDCDANTTSGCLRRVYSCAGVQCEQGSVPSDPTNPNYQTWALETAMDVEWVHALAPAATIVLVEVQPTGTAGGFADPTLDDLLGGVDVAVRSGLGVSVVSMSWGGAEFACEVTPPCHDTLGNPLPQEDAHFIGISNVIFIASAGDAGHGVLYPAASPYVIGVGGTKLSLSSTGGYKSETAWSGTGGGLSQFETEPSWQNSYPIPNETTPAMRGTPDVSYDGSPASGVAVYNSVPGGSSGWSQLGGTSVGAPQWSALFALANSSRSTPLTANDGALYTIATADGDTAFHDVSAGHDGNCGTTCKAHPGYDYLTGLGTPKADVLVPALVAH